MKKLRIPSLRANAARSSNTNSFPRSSMARRMRLESLEDRRLLAAVHGQKWDDLNADGIKDAGEPGLNGWTIEIHDSEGNLVASAVTADMDVDEDGSINPETETGLYWINDLDAGNYFVSEMGQEGWIQSSSQAEGSLLFELAEPIRFRAHAVRFWI